MFRSVEHIQWKRLFIRDFESFDSLVHVYVHIVWTRVKTLYQDCLIRPKKITIGYLTCYNTDSTLENFSSNTSFLSGPVVENSVFGRLLNQ